MTNGSQPIAVITGASSGIGLSCVHKFCDLGYQVFGVARREQDLNRIAEQIKNTKRGAFVPSILDLSSVAAIGRFFESIKISKLDALINCAGIGAIGPIETLTPERWNETMQINVLAPFLLTKYAIPFLQKSSNPAVVNVSSIAGRTRSLSLGADYSTSKAALIGMTRHLAAELGKYKIRVNATCPSQTETPMLDAALTATQKKELSQKIPLNRLASSEEQAEVIAFLCSSAASYVNGAVIDVNGGQL